MTTREAHCAAINHRIGAALLTAGLIALPATATAGPAMHYVMHPLRVPAGTKLTAAAANQYGANAIALAANGAVAAIVNGTKPTDAASRIVVWRANGSRVTIPLPSGALLHEGMRHAELNAPPSPYTAFRRIVLAGDGTPFATVGYTFSGAYLGTDMSVYRWTGQAWKYVAPPKNARASDFTVVAAELSGLHLSVIGDYSGDPWNIDWARDGSYVQQAWIARGTSWHLLGSGVLEAVVGAFACGARSERDGKAQSFGWASPYAMLWHDGREYRLGRGIAFGVNANGVAVGDDRRAVSGDGSDGVPTRWDARGVTKLSHETGTAYAIAADGTAVGALGSRGGFVVRNGVPIALDRLTSGPHILGAYAINDRGRILVQTGTSAAPSLAYLDPAT